MPPIDLERLALEPRALERAAEALRSGSLVAFPTETVYGLGADATNGAAVARIFAVKGRPAFNPLIVHVATLRDAEAHVAVDLRSERLAAAFWPGPLTLVLPRRADSTISLLCSAGLDSIAIRAPAHPLAVSLLAATGRPIAAPSANRSGRVSPTTAQHVRDELGGDIAHILDGGACQIGVESTVLDLTSDRITLLRPGGLPLEAIEALIGPIEIQSPSETAAPRSPGMLASHYAPSIPVRLDAARPEPGEAFLAFGQPEPGTIADIQLSGGRDLEEAAAKLFAALRSLDRPPYRGIAVMPVPETGLGRAINDRLRRAAAPRG